MSDFYSILRKSILDRGITNGGDRNAIYDQARRAMIRRLWTFDPPLAEDEIDRRIAAFDAAVSDIEADVMATFSDVDDPPAEVEDDYVEPHVPYGRDDRAADYYDTDPYAAGGREPAYREPEYREPEYREPEYREPEDYPVANPRRLPALIDPVAFGRQVREAGLVRYHEEARRLEREQQAPPYDPRYDAPPYDSRYDAPPRDPRYDAPPYEPRYSAPLVEPEVDEPPMRPRSRALARQRIPEPPVDPYEDEPGYGDVPPPPAWQQREHDRWSEDAPRRTARGAREPRPAADPRRIGPDDDLPRRRRRKRSRKPISDRDKIFMLLGAIGVCVLVLGGIGVYVLVPADGGVTVDIDSRQEVSDAATAVRLANQAMPVDQTFMLFDGRDPTVFETSPDNPIRFDDTSGTVRVSSSTGSAGVKALIGPGLATRLAGHDVRVTIVARSAKVAGAASMRFAYQSGVAISHWQTANLGPDYQAVALTWRVPALQTDRSGDVLLIQPGVPGDGTGANIKSIKIDLLSG